MKHFWLYSFFLLFHISVSQNIQIEKLDIKNGLPDNSVRDIIQDKHGYLWFGTLNGLSRYNGNSFKNYNTIPGDTTSLTNSRMIKILEDKRGFIWCWSRDNNLQRVNPATNEVFDLNSYVLHNQIAIQDFKIISNGDIWVWGDNGCARIQYQGNANSLKAKIFNQINGIKNIKVHFVFEDLNKNIWIGTEKGLINLNSSDDKANIKVHYPNINFISYNIFNNQIWLGTKRQGVFNFSKEKNSFSPSKFLNTKLGFNSVLSINQYDSETLLLGLENVLVKFNLVSHKVTKVHHKLFNGISRFYNDSFKNTWLIAQKRGVFKYDINNNKVTYYDLNAPEREFLGGSDKVVILEDSNKNLWLGVHSGGLFLYNREQNEFKNYSYNEEKQGGLSSDIILSLYEDASKNLWVGTMYGGVNKINLSKDYFTWYNPVEKPKNIFSNEIRAAVQDRNSTVWLGSKGGNIFGYKNDSLNYTFPDDLSKNSKHLFKNVNVYCLYIDHQDNLWIGTKGKGLFIVKNITNETKDKFEIIHFNNNKSKALNDVYSIVQDKTNSYWIGSHGYGLAHLTSPFSSPKIETFNTENKHLISNYIRYLFLDIDNNLWIATSDGINFLNSEHLTLKEKKFLAIKNIKDEITSLSFNSVDHIYQSVDKTVYIATMGGGVDIITHNNIAKRNFQFKHLSTSNGLSSNKIFAIQEDIYQNIWFSTSLGLNKYYPRNGKFEHFFIEKNHGLNYFSEGCVSKLSNGDFLFGHHRGFLSFNPKDITKDTTHFPLVFSKLFINGNEQRPRQSDILSKNIEYENELNLSHNQNTIQLDFSVLDYKRPEKIQYTYKLDNFDADWSVPLTQNTAIYQNLPHGSYTFLLKATNSDGVELAGMQKIKINIKPPFLKSNLGYLITFLIFGFIFFCFLYLYKKQISAKQEVIFTDKLNEKKIVYYTNISHEFKTPLSLISCHLEDIIDEDSLSETSKTSIKKIQKSTSYLLNLVEQILDFRKIREEKKKLQLVNTNIFNTIKDIHNQFSPLATKENIELIFNYDSKNLLGYIDVNIVKKIVYNLLSNAIKFTPANKLIKISVKRIKNNEFVKIKIKDQGKGISKEDQEHLFERFGKSENSSGIGLFYVKELVNCHKGAISVKSELKKGTCFIITLPINKKYYPEVTFEKENVIVNDSNFYEQKIEFNNNEIDENDVKKSKSILIIDDNNDIRDYLKSKFSKHFSVLTAENGKVGLDVAIKKLPDIIICDLMMPVLDGLNTVKLLRENFNTCHIPIILLTANASEYKKIEGIKIGADDYITKPFNFKYLKLKVDSVIEQRDKMIKSFSKNPTLSSSILTQSNEDKTFVDKVKNIVENSIGEPNFGINFILEKLGLSRTVFYKKMKEITGETPHEFISTIQMKKAALLLKSTNYTISEISQICGFNDANYFSKIFKKYFGQTPKSFQLKHKSNKKTMAS
ncbi:hypothetical protein PK35_03095 [Tamlana nanhaiensis]|uniref:histidine kinase n=1 Tax=Neotamlana nanhaiensis TaxID=1382798 RepID=A0A0D7W7V4_9FLAO|nr:hybrid sensor histidine kinase/response regulator transcription factor [Tamlana nanhaiensis]KJD34748.1 hypothetical protein PK35_03095 [Tamlana nanhaiensis]